MQTNNKINKTDFNVYDFLKGDEKNENFDNYTSKISLVNAELNFELNKRVTCLVGNVGSGKTYHVKKFSYSHPSYNYIYIGAEFNATVPNNTFIDEKGYVHSLQQNSIKSKAHIDEKTESSTAIIFNDFFKNLDLATKYARRDTINVFIIEDIRPRIVIEYILSYLSTKIKADDKFIVTVQPWEAFPAKYNYLNYQNKEIYLGNKKVSSNNSVFSFDESNTEAYITYKNYYDSLNYLIPINLSNLSKLNEHE